MSSLYPGSQQIAPMKYANKPSESQILAAWDSGEWIAQEKKDGAWYQLEKTDEGNIYLFGRTLSKKTGEYTEKIGNVPHIFDWAEKNLPNGTTLIGEIYIPGGKSNDVTKIMGCTAANAYKRQFESSEYQPVHYYVFDCIRYNSKNLCEEHTIDRIEHYLHYMLVDIFENEEYIELAETYYSDFQKHLQSIFQAGGEGMVFKNKNCPYRAGMRTTAKQMFKYKEHMDSVDLICMELLDPIKEYTGKEIETWPFWYDKVDKHCLYIKDESLIQDMISSNEYQPITKPYYFGWKNGMRLGAYKNGQLIEVCKVASGLTDVLRQDMAVQPKIYFGKVIEIECMSINKKDGTVRHPVFKQVREDKDPQDCQWNEIFGQN